MKLAIVLLLACLACSGCSRRQDHFIYQGQEGPYIPRYLHFHPATK